MNRFECQNPGHFQQGWDHLMPGISIREMVELRRALSNPLVKDEVLPKVLKLYHRLQSRSTPKPKKTLEVKKRPGEVSKVIYQVLSDSGTTMRCKEIQLAVENRLGHPVGWSNVKQHL